MKKLLFLVFALLLVACGGSSTDSIGIPEGLGGAESCSGGAPDATGGSMAEAGSNTGGAPAETGGKASTGGDATGGTFTCDKPVTSYAWDAWYMRGGAIANDHLYQVIVTARALYPVDAFCIVDPLTEEVTTTCYVTEEPETCANTCVQALRTLDGVVATFCGKDLTEGLTIDFGIGRLETSPGALYTATSKQGTKKEFTTFFLDIGASDTCK